MFIDSFIEMNNIWYWYYYINLPRKKPNIY
jgi:hypothetical protein